MQKGLESDNCCVHCGAVGESREHVLVHCSYMNVIVKYYICTNVNE
jgi:hypothetical protein